MAHMIGINEVAGVLSRSKSANVAVSGETEVISLFRRKVHSD
jgi:hypothetical protein